MDRQKPSMTDKHRLLRNGALACNLMATAMTLLTYDVGPSRKFMLIAGCAYWAVAVPIFVRRWNNMTLPHLYFLVMGQVLLSVVLAGVFARPRSPAQ
jgi:hypothetical protein